MLFLLILLISTVTSQLEEELPNPIVPTKQPINQPETTKTVILEEQNKHVEEVFEITENFKELDKNLVSPWKTSKFQWEVAVNSNSTEIVRVIIQHGNDTKSLRLPYSRTLNRNKIHTTAPLPGRSIDLCPNEMVTKDSKLIVTLISSSNNPIEVNISARVVKDTDGWEYLDPQDHSKGQELNGSISLSTTLVRKTTWTPNISVTSVKLTIESWEDSDCFCSVVSVQQPSCPYFDSISTATRFGTWQTISDISTMVLDSSEFPEGFLVVVVASENDKFCHFKKKNCTEENRTKRKGDLTKKMTIRLEPLAGDDIRNKAVLIVLAIYLIIVATSFILSEIQFRYDYKLFEGIDSTSIIPIIAFAASMVIPKDSTDNGESEDEKKDNIINMKEEEKHTFKKYLSDMSSKVGDPEKAKSIYKKDTLFLGNLLLVSVFYSIAVFQLAFQSAAEHRNSGNHNICYFNSKCQIPSGQFLDFNHFFSNLGYMVFGLIFLGIVWRKNVLFKRLLGTNEGNTRKVSTCNVLATMEDTHGVPFYTGIYYTMGAALAMEGVMSACYHICPTTISFQFDTTFMYLIAILIYSKLYQNRHPDVSANSIHVYLVLGAALILEALALYFSGPEFWTVFCLLYMLTILVLVSNMYELHYLQNRERGMPLVRAAKLLVKEMLYAIRRLRGREAPKIRPLLVFLSIVSLFNIGICIFFAINAAQNERGASNYLLLMFMANTAVYAIYYIVMKYISGEGLCTQSKLYQGESQHLFAKQNIYFFYSLQLVLHCPCPLLLCK